jgi:hypothetical protein
MIRAESFWLTEHLPGRHPQDKLLHDYGGLMQSECTRISSRRKFGRHFSLALLIVLALQILSWASAIPVQNTPLIPVGTVIPTHLGDALDVKTAHVGQTIEGRVTQEVPLPNKEKIALRSRVIGSVVSVEKGADGSGAKLTIRFAQLEDKKQPYPITTSLRAMASYLAVRSAQLPAGGGPDTGTPAGWADTVQIGGDIRYGDGGKVRNRQKQAVGKGVLGGVLVHLSPNPSGGCEGGERGNDRLQALWVFSADACGVYGLKEVKIAHDGKTERIGDITLEFAKNDVNLETGTAFLLRTVAKPQ